MIINTLKNTNNTEVINILYDLYRIFHKAEDGIFYTAFPDSDLNEKEKTILNTILADIDLRNHLGDRPFLSNAFSELNFFQNNILNERLSIDRVASAKKNRRII